MMKEWIMQQGPKLWWKVAVTLFLLGGVYANVLSQAADHDTRTKNVETVVTGQKKAMEDLSKEAKETKELMQKMLKVSKATCLNSAKNDTARLLCLGD